MSRSFAGGVIREVEIIAERLVPLMDDMPDQWERELFWPAAELRVKLLQFEAWLIEQKKDAA